MRVGVFGAPLDTGNLGVSALGVATAHGVLVAHPGAEVTIFDSGPDVRTRELIADDWRARVEFVPSVYSRRLYQSKNQQQAWAAARLGLARFHPFLRRLASLDAVLDVSGGDSFSDLYGPRRFRSVRITKKLALRVARRLVLLPQTYGPFRNPKYRRDAAELIGAADQVWARDARSLAVVRDLLGASFDPEHHRAGVDVAFGLPTRTPSDDRVRERIQSARADGKPVLGLNVSGLLYLADDRGSSSFGLRESYRELILEVALALLVQHEAHLLLVPHVTRPCQPFEDDTEACRDLRGRLPEEMRSRVVLAPACQDPMEAKWVIGRCDWFCGSRMHSCIAGLSQAIPTATIAYSDKSLGVFESADSGDWVFDPRAMPGRDLVASIAATVKLRHERALRLGGVRDRIDTAWRDQFQRIVKCASDTSST